mgnify:CR=1 FL=1
MTCTTTQHTQDFLTAPQLSTDDFEELAASGIKTIINNRPDGEGGAEQPSSEMLSDAAAQVGIQYYYLPVVSGQLTDEQTQKMAQILAAAPTPVLAFCRSGARSTDLWQKSKAHLNTPAAQVSKHGIVIVGGGAAGISLASSLLKRQSNLIITIIEPSEQHYYQPAWTLVGGGAFDVADSVRSMASVMPRQVKWIKAAVTEFKPDANQVVLSNGASVDYEYLAVAPGLQINWDAIEGLTETLGKNGVTSNYRFDLAPYTWTLVQGLKSGNAIFTQPPMPIKCAGAPQKAMYLACSEWLKQGTLNSVNVDFFNAGAVLFGVETFVPPLMAYVKKYDITLNFTANLVKVDGPNKTAWFDVKDSNGDTVQVSRSFDMLHVVPPQSAPDFLKKSELGNADGWVDVDQYTLQHTRFKNIFGLGDACSSPNAKTAAATRKQVVAVAENLISLMNNKPMTMLYDGYGSCPLTVERGKIVLAEFGFGGKLLPTFPLDPAKPRKMAWHLKKTILPWFYWNGMLKGREWLAKPVQN